MSSCYFWLKSHLQLQQRGSVICANRKKHKPYVHFTLRFAKPLSIKEVGHHHGSSGEEQRSVMSESLSHRYFLLSLLSKCSLEPPFTLLFPNIKKKPRVGKRERGGKTEVKCILLAGQRVILPSLPILDTSMAPHKLL